MHSVRQEVVEDTVPAVCLAGMDRILEAEAVDQRGGEPFRVAPVLRGSTARGRRHGRTERLPPAPPRGGFGGSRRSRVQAIILAWFMFRCCSVRLCRERSQGAGGALSDCRRPRRLANLAMARRSGL